MLILPKRRGLAADCGQRLKLQAVAAIHRNSGSLENEPWTGSLIPEVAQRWPEGARKFLVK